MTSVSPDLGYLWKSLVRHILMQIWPFFLDIRWYLICFDCLLGARHQLNLLLISTQSSENTYGIGTVPAPHPILQRKKLRHRKARCPALGHRQWSGKAKKGHSRLALKPRFWPSHHAAFCNHCQCMSVWISLSRSTAKAITSSSLKITNVYMANEKKKKKTWLRIKCSVASRYKWLYHKTT